MVVILGYGREIDVFNLGDTANLRAFIYNDDDSPVSQDDLVSVEFTIQPPDESSRITIEGTIDEDGQGIGIFNETDAAGQFVVVASFLFDDGTRRSSRCDFEVIDPFDPPDPEDTEILGEAVWHRFEDMFDANDEGPWLRDQTLNWFNRNKMPEFVNDALFEINNANPPTTADLGLFVHQGALTLDGPLLVQATYMAVVRHLIRSYTEQPLPTGNSFGYLDRRDYAQRWMTTYQLEQDTFKRWLALWKRKYLALGHSKLLISSKAGRLIQAPQRTRFVGRGYF